MNRFWLILIFFMTIGDPLHNAAAFSREDNNQQNSDGTTKYTDPDEKPPVFISPGNGNAATSNQPYFPSTNLPSVGERDGGARAFDQAFAHQQNNR